MPKYFYRLILFTLLLVAAPVVSIGMISYHIASQDIERKVNEGNAQILLQNQMRIEEVLKNVEMAAVQYLNSSLVMDSIHDPLTPEDFQTIANLGRGLYNLHSLSGVADTYLVNMEMDWMISKLGFTTIKEFSDRNVLDEYADHPQNLFWLASGSGQGKQDNGVREKEGDRIRLIVKLPMIATSTAPKALLLIDMSHSELEQDLAQDKTLGDIYILNRERVPFLSNPGSVPIQDVVMEKLRTVTDASGYFEGDAMAVNYKVSPYNNWTYASVVSIEGMTRESKKIAMLTLNVCLVIFVVIAAIAFYGSRRMYSPIRRLFVIMEQIGGEPADSKKKDEFAFIEDRFHALFSTRKQLQQQLHGQLSQMKEFFLLKLFMGQITESEFLFKSETYGFAGKGKALGVLALQIDSLQETRYMESDKELLLFAINNIVGELLPGHRLVGALLFDQSQVSLLTGDTDEPAENKAYFHQTAEQIKSKVHELLQLKASIGISRSFFRYTDAMNAYSEALDALKRRIRLGSDIILHYDDFVPAHGDVKSLIPPLHHLEDYIVNAFISGDAESAMEHFDHYVASITERDIQFNDYQVFMLQLVARIYQLVRNEGGRLDGLIGSNSAVTQFVKLNTVQEVSVWFKTELLPPTIAFFKKRADSEYINTAHQMVQMIHEQYDEDISLESCAAALKFHPVYLSRVFKKEIGVTFIEYLTDYRMTMAKMMLEHTDLKITEIADRLNYTNSTGFIRTFRKLTGMTPGQYRQTLSKLK
ncbi:helix-turn-helix domain-containing protein [Paenibacillus sp. YK5]